MALWHHRRFRSVAPGLRAELRLGRTAAIGAAALLAFAAPAHAHIQTALARTAEALTGLHDLAQLSTRGVCAPATPSTATCEARVLVTAGGTPVHPHVRRRSAGAPTGVSHSALTDALSAASPHAGAPAAAPEPQPGTPAYMQQAYDLTYLSRYGGASDTVAIVDAYDDPSAAADLATYRSYFGLPPCTTVSGCFRKVDERGGQSFPAPNSGWADEISLDLDAVSAICPNCRIALVEANSDNSQDLATAQAEAASLGVNQITDSWGWPTATAPSQQFTFAGISTVAASGDQGYLGLLVNQYPAALPNVTAAGGTDLIPASASGSENARGFTEQAWSDAGSGCALLSAKPAWQSDRGCTGRTYSDLSANANPQTGLNVYDSQGGGWLVMGGTSEAAPVIAAYYAITGASGATSEWPYQHGSLLNAPAGGSNGTCALSIAYICIVGQGYSGPTGVGSISGAVVPGAPGFGGPGPRGNYTQATGSTSAQLQAGVYPNGSDTTYLWEYGTSTSYNHTTAPADAGSGQSIVPISSNLSGLAPGTTYHYRLVASNAMGVSYGYDFTLQTSGALAPSGESLTTVKVTGPRTASVRGRVDVEDGSMSYRFLYGTRGSYQHATTWNTAWGSSGASVGTTLSRLSPHTTYQVRLVARSGGGLRYSAPRTFTTNKVGR